MKCDYDFWILEYFYKVGDVVYVFDIVIVKGKCRKFSLFWKGFGVIVEKLFVYLYKVKLCGKIIIMNYDCMKICRDCYFLEWI